MYHRPKRLLISHISYHMLLLYSLRSIIPITRISKLYTHCIVILLCQSDPEYLSLEMTKERYEEMISAAEVFVKARSSSDASEILSRATKLFKLCVACYIMASSPLYWGFGPKVGKQTRECGEINTFGKISNQPEILYM